MTLVKKILIVAAAAAALAACACPPGHVMVPVGQGEFEGGFSPIQISSADAAAAPRDA